MSNFQIIANAFIALFAFLGAMGGVVLGRYLQNKSWEKEFNITFKKDIIEERIKLMERMSFLLHKSSRLQVLQSIIENQRIFTDMDVIIVVIKENNGKFPEGWLDKMMKVESLLEINKEMLDITAEFGAVASLSRIYFGRKTGEALEKISKLEKWFILTTQDRQMILDCMGEELHEFRT